MPRTNTSVLKVERSVRTALVESGLSSGKKLIVAVSGGPDSLTLLYALQQLSTDFDLTLHAAHLNGDVDVDLVS